MFEIALEKVGFIITAARADDNFTTPGEFDSGDAITSGLDVESVEEGASRDESSDLAEFINGLNEDEKLDLVTLMWIGRGTYTKDQWDEARDLAASEAVNATSEYLMGTPLMADYLEEGLSAFGCSMEDIEELEWG